MKKIRIEFEGPNSTEFTVKVEGGLTHRDLLVLARELPAFAGGSVQVSSVTAVEIKMSGLGQHQIVAQMFGDVDTQHLQLVADEFYLAATHAFMAQQNQAMMQAAQNQIAIAKLQRGGRRNSGLTFPGGRG
jgi:hypothetical protein